MANPNYRNKYVGKVSDRTNDAQYEVEVTLDTKGPTAMPDAVSVRIGTRRVRIEMLDGEPWAYTKREAR